MSLSTDSSEVEAVRTDALYQTVFDAMAEGVVVLSATGVVITANPAATQILSLSPQRLPGLSLLQPVMRAIREDGSELPGADYPAMVSLRSGQAVSGFVMGVYKSADELVWISVNSRLIGPIDPAGAGEVVVTFSDISALKRTEAQLRESEIRLRNILHHTPIATAIITLDGRFSEVNRAFCAIVGFSREALRNRDFQSITDPSDLHGHDEVPRMLDGSLDSYQSERCFRHRNGGVIWILLSVTLERNERGEPIHFIVQMQDIGERRAAAERHARLSQRLSLAAGCAEIGVWEWEILDNAVHADERVCAIYGLPPQTAPSSLEWWRAFLVPEDVQHVLDAFQRTLGERGRVTVEYRIRRSDGIVRYVQMVADVILEGDVVKSLVGVILDITDRKLAEQDISAARSQLRTLIDTLPAWVAMLDRDGCILVANNQFCESIGRPMAEVEGRYVQEVIPPEFRPRHTQLIERCLNGEAIEFMEQGSGISQDLPVHCHGRYVPLYEGARVAGLVLALTDVSELKRAQLQLTRLNADLVNKVAEVHQLQTRLHEMAVRDALTGLHNRRFLDEQLPYELARARRLQLPLCIALGDIDHFKQLNDTYGHQAGDAVLRALRELFTQMVRDSDLVCRWGGEEILIVMPDVAGDVALARIERLREALAAQTIGFGLHQLRVTISFGIAAQQDGASADEIIGAADMALYEAKAAGRNTSRLFQGLIPRREEAGPNA